MNAEYKNDMRFTTQVDSPAPCPGGNGMKDGLMQDLIKLGRAELRSNGSVVYAGTVWTLRMDHVWRPANGRLW